MRLLAGDVGNSAIKLAVFDRTRILSVSTVPHTGRSADAVHTELASTVEGWHFDRAAFCSVVPVAGTQLHQVLERRNVPVARIDHEAKLPIRLAYADPAMLGADRIAAASAALQIAADTGHSRQPVIAIDAGTATTFKLFVGGLIWAGPDLVRRALHGGTAQLPLEPHAEQPPLIGAGTREAIRAGAWYGFVEGVRGILARLIGELDAPPFVVATGGRGGILHQELSDIDVHEAALVLHGVRLIDELNR